MSEEKCFCHLGEYAVKDATARAEIEKVKKDFAESEEKHILEHNEVVGSILDINTNISELEGKVSDLERNDVHPMYWRVLVTVEDDPVANETEIELSDVDTTVDLTGGTQFCALVNATTSKKLFRCYFSKREYVSETTFKALVTSVTEIEVGSSGSSGSSGDTLTTVEHVRVGDTAPLGTELVFPPERFNRTPVKGDTFGLAYVDTTNMKLYNCILTVGDLDPDYNVDMYICTITTAVIIWNMPQASAGTTLNKYTVTSQNSGSYFMLNLVTRYAKGHVNLTLRKWPQNTAVTSVQLSDNTKVNVHYMGYASASGMIIGGFTLTNTWQIENCMCYKIASDGTVTTDTDNPMSYGFILEYWNDFEITTSSVTV